MTRTDVVTRVAVEYRFVRCVTCLLVCQSYCVSSLVPHQFLLEEDIDNLPEYSVAIPPPLFFSSFLVSSIGSVGPRVMVVPMFSLLRQHGHATSTGSLVKL